MSEPGAMDENCAEQELPVIIAGELLSMSIASTEFAYLRALTVSLGSGVTIYHLPETGLDDADINDCVVALTKLGANVSSLPWDDSFRATHLAHGQIAIGPAQILEWARRTTPRNVHFVGAPHYAYFLLQARQVGLLKFDLNVVLHVITTFGYRVAIGREAVDEPADLGMLQIENAVLSMADTVATQSTTIANWITEHQGTRPEQIRKAPPLWADIPDTDPRVANGDRRHILFSGTLTETKGLATSVHIVRYLKQVHEIAAFPIFSGRTEADFPVREYLTEELGNEGEGYKVIPPIDHPTFLTQLMDVAVVVVPSRLDEKPAIVDECTSLGIPVIASAVGDLAQPTDENPPDFEIVANDYRAIGDRIAMVLSSPAGTTKAHHPSNVAISRKEKWGEFVKGLPDGPTALTQGGGPAIHGNADPLVSICIAHHNRPHLLEITIESLLNQTYSNTELVIVDDGSEPNHVDAVDRMVAPISNARLFRTTNQYLGAARNTAAENANGDFLLFVDDDNFAKPHEVETFVDCMRQTDADIMTCFSDNFVGDGRPDSASRNGVRRLPLGAALGLNLFRNCFGDSNCFVKRDAWKALGGFTEHYRIGLDDHEFFLRAHLEGFRLELVPEALYYYRLGQEKMKRFHVSKRANEQRIMTTLVDHSDYSILDIATLYLARNLASDDR